MQLKLGYWSNKTKVKQKEALKYKQLLVLEELLKWDKFHFHCWQCGSILFDSFVNVEYILVSFKAILTNSVLIAFRWSLSPPGPNSGPEQPAPESPLQAM